VLRSVLAAALLTLAACGVQDAGSIDGPNEASLAQALAATGTCEALLPEKGSVVPCPDDVIALGEKDGRHWCFTFDDGWSDCDATRDKDAAIHDMTIHISCSADFDDDGYADKKQPSREDGDPAIVDYSIVKYKVLGGGWCSVSSACCQSFDVVVDNPDR
jgi:hypothetical protein